MGLLVDGQWVDEWYDTDSTGGNFVRSDSQFRNWITADGQAGPTGEAGFKAQAGRYHLYVSLACPWAHRALVFRALKGLEDMISVSVVNPYMGEQGWNFASAPGVVADPVQNANYLYELYQRGQADYTGRVTVPLLWDLHLDRPVSNESADIIRMFNSAFDKVGAKAGDYVPAARLAEIEEVNALVYDSINNGVYKAGFATEQDVYEQEVTALFAALDQLEERLSRQRYLLGAYLTETDWRLFTTLIRFDPVYYGHFKCNLQRLKEYPNLWGYMLELYQWPGVAATFNLDHVKEHYYGSHPTINPNGIVPLGPRLDLHAEHGRDRAYV